MTRRMLRVATMVVLVFAGWWLLQRMRGVSSRSISAVIRRRAHDLRNRWKGMRYRLAGRRPDPWVGDEILADRVRSTLGPLEKVLDVPRVHVEVHDHVASLHGEVGEQSDANELVRATNRISGIFGIESFLHVGLRPDARPSEGRSHPAPSPARLRLLTAATRAGVPEDRAAITVRAVLGALLDRLPVDERDQVLAHLPLDVRALAEPPQRVGQPPRIRSLADLVADVTAQGVGSGEGSAVTESVFAELRQLVPEEAGDIAAVLPAELRDLWNSAVPA